MEYSLHRQLKDHYAQGGNLAEVRLGKYRIDVVRGEELIEIQHGPLRVIRDKLRTLLAEHRLLVVKPIVVRKLLVKHTRRGGRVVERRYSPGRWSLLDVFDELVSLTQLFPHERLTIEALPVEIEELRWPRRGRRRYRRRDYHVEDQRIVEMGTPVRLATAGDLRQLLSEELSGEFGTAELAALHRIDRAAAQRIAYCLRHMGTATLVGKQGNALRYALAKCA